MLKIEDLARHSDAELADIVAERCSGFGSITRVTVYPARSGGAARPFAIVVMTTRDDAEGLSAAFGGRTVGNAVVIFLEQPVKSALPAIPVAREVPNNVVALSATGSE
jgi:hypothetical protein